jgi:ParB/RepB/Spo0J family partition protein
VKPEFREIPLNQIVVEKNYRETFDDKQMGELAQSIKENGVVEPIIVRPKGKKFAIVARERRYRASLLAKTATIPAVVRDIADAEILKLQIIENVQRAGVPYMEEARGLQRLRDELSLDVAEICKVVGKSDAWVYQTLSLVRMDDEAQRMAANGFLAKPVAMLIARLPNHEAQNQAANDLARTNRTKLVDIRFARRYIEEKIQSNGMPQIRQRKNATQKAEGNDYCANWKRYLVRFTTDQFEYWKSIVKGRTETAVLSEAVDVVMRGGVNVSAGLD